MQITKSEALQWIHSILPNANVLKVEQLGSGVVFCQLLHAFCPTSLQPAKINVKAKSQVENILNFKLLQQAFIKIGVRKQMEMDKLSKHSFQENLDLLLFLHKYLEANKDRLGQLTIVPEKKTPHIPSQRLKNKENSLIQINHSQTAEINDNQREQIQKIMQSRELDYRTKLKEISKLMNLEFESETKILEETHENDNDQGQSKLFLSEPRPQSQTPIYVHDDTHTGKDQHEDMDLLNFQNVDVLQQLHQSRYSNNKILSHKLPSLHQDNQLQYEMTSVDEEPLLLSRRQSEMKMTEEGFTFRKDSGVVSREQEDRQPKNDISDISFASSQKKIYNLQTGSCQRFLSNSPIEGVSISPEFSKIKRMDPNRMRTEVQMLEEPLQDILMQTGSYIFPSSQANYFQTDTKPTFSIKEIKKEAQSLPVSKNKYWEFNQDSLHSLQKAMIPDSLRIVQTGQMIPEY